MELCDLCLEYKEQTRYIDLYMRGSEGLHLCHECEMELVKICTKMALSALRRRKADIARRSVTEH